MSMIPLITNQLHRLRSVLLLLAALALASCASNSREQNSRPSPYDGPGGDLPDKQLVEFEPEPEAIPNNDPLEGMNRVFFSLNQGLDTVLFRPITTVYQTVLPKPLRNGVANFFSNLSDPITAANQLLQGKPKEAASNLPRFLINSTVGLAGFFDPATKMGLEKHHEDFGQTLAVWGVPAGPYLVLPVLGPSNMRDAPARVAPWLYRVAYLDLLQIQDAGLTLTVSGMVNDRSEASGKIDAVDRAAIDRYLFVREAYIQRREFLIDDREDTGDSADDFSVELPPDLDTE